MHNILIVDDNYAQDIKLMLSDDIAANFELALNGLEGVKKFKESKTNNSNFSLIIMDINMPVMNGIEATKEIRKIDKNIPIIVYSALNVSKFIEDSLNAGANKFIRKGGDLNSEVKFWLNL